jgi:hypothetical protein
VRIPQIVQIIEHAVDGREHRVVIDAFNLEIGEHDAIVLFDGELLHGGWCGESVNVEDGDGDEDASE